MVFVRLFARSFLPRKWEKELKCLLLNGANFYRSLTPFLSFVLSASAEFLQDPEEWGKNSSEQTILPQGRLPNPLGNNPFIDLKPFPDTFVEVNMRSAALKDNKN